MRILEQGSIDRSTAEAIVEDIRSQMHEIKRVTEATVLDDDERAALTERYDELGGRLSRAQDQGNAPDALAAIPESERAAVQRMLALIYECSANRVAAKALVDRILARLGE